MAGRELMACATAVHVMKKSEKRASSLCRSLYVRMLLKPRNRGGIVTCGMQARSILKEESEIRNERDVVPAAIRAGPNRRNFFGVFCVKVFPCNETPRSRVFGVLEFF